MNVKTVKKILADTAYVRYGGSAEERRCAEYLQGRCEELGLFAKIEAFPIEMYETEAERLVFDGKEIAYGGSGSGNVSGKIHYLSTADEIALHRCRNRIVLVDKGIGASLYDRLLEVGAIGLITYNGNMTFPDRDVDRREFSFFTEEEDRLPAVNIHIKDAFSLIRRKDPVVEITVKQNRSVGYSHNVVLDLEGESEEWVVLSAHYDSTSCSVGAYDNMSGCIGLLQLAEYFSKRPRHRGLRFLFCGSEERGLVGSLSYLHAHQSEVKKIILNVNLDMMGSVMGEFAAFSCADEAMEAYLSSFLKKHRFSASVRYGIRSSDSNSFVHYGIPAVSFARYASAAGVPIHTRYDVAEAVSAENLLKEMRVIASFAESFVKDEALPLAPRISAQIENDVKIYMNRKKYSEKGE